MSLELRFKCAGPASPPDLRYAESLWVAVWVSWFHGWSGGYASAAPARPSRPRSSADGSFPWALRQAGRTVAEERTLSQAPTPCLRPQQHFNQR